MTDTGIVELGYSQPMADETDMVDAAPLSLLWRPRFYRARR